MRGVGKRAGRRWFAWAAGIGLLAAGVHGAGWFVITGRIEAGLPVFIAAAADRGVLIKHGPAHRSGWPWAAQVDVADVAVEQGPLDLRWRADRVSIALLPGDLKGLSVTPVGSQAIEIAGWGTLAIAGGSERLRLPFAAEEPVRVSVRDVVAKASDGHGLRVSELEAQVGGDAAAGRALVQPLQAWPAPFDGPADIAARLVAHPSWPDGAAGGATATAAAAWQAAQGRLDVPEFSFNLGPLQVSGTGTGGLDQALQPRFEATLQVRGVDQALDAAVQAGALMPGPAAAAKAVLTVLSLASGGGPAPAPARLEDGLVSVANFPLLRVPRVAWPSP